MRTADRHRRNVGRFARFVALVVLVIGAGEGHASDVLVSQSPEERALGIERPALSLLFDARDDSTGVNRWRARAGQWDLFGIEDLSVGVGAVEVRRGGWVGALSAAVVSSVVGDEKVLVGAVLVPSSRRIHVAGKVRVVSLALGGCERASLWSLSGVVVVDVSPELVLCSGVENVHAAGERLRGADASLKAVIFPRRSLSLLAHAGVTRSGDLRLGVSCRVSAGRGVFVALGYEERTGALNGALSLRVRSLGFDIGASVHPVLGVSKGLFLSWGRGR